MKLNTVIEHMPLNREVAIYVGKELFFRGSAFDFIGAKKPKRFRSKTVLRMFADDNILKVIVSKETASIGSSER